MRNSISNHQPVMVAEVLKGLNIRKDGIYCDATFGRGGHTHAILNQLNENGRLLALDRDEQAALVANELAKNDSRFTFRKASFSKLSNICAENHLIGKVDGLLVDLGVSSPQLDEAERGFSFQKEGPLDMRMDQSQGLTLETWINTADEEEITKILKEYGEERFAFRIAKAIVKAREENPINNTKTLSEIVSKANPAWEKHKHPATRSFMAFRLFINDELNELNQFLEQALKVLAPGGRLVVISFHSLEDRIVKQFIQKHEKGEELKYPRGLPVMNAKFKPVLKKVGKKQKPSDEEIRENPRARSAVLRVAQKVLDHE